MAEPILCVDDEPVVVALLKRIFTAEGYDVHVAGSGEEALQVLDKISPTVVVADYRMPGMSGVQLLEEVQLHSPDSIRIILTGYADTDLAVDAINKGHVYRFLTKPWEDSELRLAVREAVRLHHLTSENRELHRQVLDQNQVLLTLNATLEAKVEERTRALQEAYQENLVLTERLQRTVRELEGRDRILQYLSAGVHELDDALTMILEVITDVLDLDRVVIYLSAGESGQIEPRACIGEPESRMLLPKEAICRLPSYGFGDPGPVGSAFRDRKLVATGENGEIVAAPILFGGTCSGVIVADNSRSGVRICNEEAAMLGRLAINVAVAVRDTQLSESLMATAEDDLEKMLAEL